tara:strand:+ start:196 stop:480 length:285 start_codon:yes stop_codon:yes gene_type:complete
MTSFLYKKDWGMTDEREPIGYYHIGLTVDGEHGTVIVDDTYPTVTDGTSAIDHVLRMIKVVYPKSKVEFDFIKEWHIEPEPEVQSYVHNSTLTH